MVSLVILWHMHQPEYADPSTAEYVLPWTRLHAVKDYDEFADVMAEHPDIHTTVNLTPVLCRQLEALADGVQDVYAQLSEKPASYLTQVEREFILSNFFKANFETLIRPYERYAELLFERGRDASPARVHEAAKQFSVQKIRDIQVWANLAWSSMQLRQTDPVIRELLAKGRHYTDEEKTALLGVHRRVCSGILGKYRKLADDGIIEISTTPYYHPILPLLLDMKDAQVAHPGLVLPKQTRPFHEDARWHVEEALAYSERTFGRRPVGMWPAEGSVSEKACDLLASSRIQWAATDEKILERSLNGSLTPMSAQALARTYRLETSHGPLHLFFRNHGLSDRVGFNYASMPTDAAVSDFLAHVRQASSGNGPSVVTVILDGENAWEYFKSGSCRPFLTELFQALERDRANGAAAILTRTCAECVQAADPPATVLPRLTPGSWINANFNIWIGHPEDNAGWDAVQTVRTLVERMPPGAPRDKAVRLLRIAEGSDWYWWFGDDHSSMDDAMFDRLFRENLAAACALAGAPVPPEILEPIKKTQADLESKPLTEMSTPTIDGMIRPFYEWLGAGRVDVSFTAGSMHKAVYYLERIYWGFDATTLYLCLELAEVPTETEVRIFFRMPDGEMSADFPVSKQSGHARLHRPDGECVLSSAFGDVLEAAIPLSVLNLSPGNRFSISCSVQVEGMEIERWPAGAGLDLVVPDEAFFSMQWMV